LFIDSFSFSGGNICTFDQRDRFQNLWRWTWEYCCNRSTLHSCTISTLNWFWIWVLQSTKLSSSLFFLKFLSF
jgi:hypothetical protein